MIKTKIKFFLSLAFVAATSSVFADAAPPPPVGIYECFGQMGALYGAVFGILDGATYATMNKQTGHYSYNPASGILTMVDGPLAHVRYLRRVFPGSDKAVFRMLDDRGLMTQYNCPRNSLKDPHYYPW